ncbi:MAG TPA: hypothetical protein ENN84_03625, partial [Candidatus Marinimicrobia bacterium]|nr:hypothetical protein [Candidatus Neomarinimicrobiota bacterium]
MIRRFYQSEKIIAAVCVGALPLGKSGILKGKKVSKLPRPLQSLLKQ